MRALIRSDYCPALMQDDDPEHAKNIATASARPALWLWLQRLPKIELVPDKDRAETTKLKLPYRGYDVLGHLIELKSGLQPRSRGLNLLLNPAPGLNKWSRTPTPEPLAACYTVTTSCFYLGRIKTGTSPGTLPPSL